MRKTAILFGLSLGVATPGRAQQPMMFINGVRIENCAGTGANRLGGIDPAAIDNVEVLKGAAAAKQYGPEAATGGVIQIATKKGALVAPASCGSASAPGSDALARFLYAPELVMAHQEAIGLTDRQRAAILDAVKDLQSKTIVDTQFKLGLAGEKLKTSLAKPNVEESSVLQQIDDMLALEREVKRAQITLLVRIKNQLTPEQRAQLDKLR